MRDWRKKAFARDEEFASARPGPILRNDKRRDDGWNDAQLHFRKPELDGLNRDADVASGDQARAAAQRSAVHAGDHRFWALGDRQEHPSDGARIREILFVGVVDHPLHPVQIGAGAKGFSIGAKDDDAGLRRAAQFVECFGNLTDEFIVEWHYGRRDGRG